MDGVKDNHNKKFIVYWFRYPQGIEGEPTDCKFKEYSSFDAALRFLKSRAKLIRGIYWAGGHIEDSDDNWLYEILDDGTEIDNR
ncbi:MAG: hypothetical protein K2M60_01075 [Lachnospiraceae bacterium]|nr:hypothetical protein [Lachnospiraceae bacterium]